MQALKPKWDK